MGVSLGTVGGIELGVEVTDVGWRLAVEDGSEVAVAAGVASPLHAALNANAEKIINAAAGSNLAGKVRTRIPTLP